MTLEMGIVTRDQHCLQKGTHITIPQKKMEKVKRRDEERYSIDIECRVRSEKIHTP